jgi:hypothetical protein
MALLTTLHNDSAANGQDVGTVVNDVAAVLTSEGVRPHLIIRTGGVLTGVLEATVSATFNQDAEAVTATLAAPFDTSFTFDPATDRFTSAPGLLSTSTALSQSAR